MKAAVYGLIGKRMTFVVTTKGKAEVMPLAALWPYVLMLGLNFAALFVGLFKLSHHPWAIGVNMFWVSYHVLILWSIFYFNQLPVLGREEHAQWQAS